LLLSIAPEKLLTTRSRINVYNSAFEYEEEELEDLGRVQTEEEVRKFVWKKIDFVLGLMQDEGYPLTITEYFHLLETAWYTRHISKGEMIWQEMKDYNIQPHTYAYNTYLALHIGTTSKLNRKIDRDQINARQQNAKRDVGMDLGQWSFKIYTEMLDKKVAPNAMTIEMMILAQSNIGNTKGMVHFMEKVWNIRATDAKDNSPFARSFSEERNWGSTSSDFLSALPSPTVERTKARTVSLDSPLRPSAHTFMAIIAAFGHHNQLPFAFHAITQLSEIYKVAIPPKVWQALLRWAYALTEKPQIQLGRRRLTPDLVWKIMKKLDSGADPEMKALDYLIRYSVEKGKLREAIRHLHGAIKKSYPIIFSKEYQHLLDTNLYRRQLLNYGTLKHKDFVQLRAQGADLNRARAEWISHIRTWIADIIRVYFNRQKTLLMAEGNKSKSIQASKLRRNIGTMLAKYKTIYDANLDDNAREHFAPKYSHERETFTAHKNRRSLNVLLDAWKSSFGTAKKKKKRPGFDELTILGLLKPNRKRSVKRSMSKKRTVIVQQQES